MTTTPATSITPVTAPPSRAPGVLERRWPTALGVAATAASLALISPLPARVQTWVSAWGVLTAAVIYLTWGTARGHLTARRWLTLETAGVLCFGALAITATASDPAAARYVLAAGWLATLPGTSFTTTPTGWSRGGTPSCAWSAISWSPHRWCPSAASDLRLRLQHPHVPSLPSTPVRDPRQLPMTRRLMPGIGSRYC